MAVLINKVLPSRVILSRSLRASIAEGYRGHQASGFFTNSSKETGSPNEITAQGVLSARRIRFRPPTIVWQRAGCPSRATEL